MNKFLFRSLAKEGWKLEIIDIPLPRSDILRAYAETFNLNVKLWKKQATAKIESYQISPRIFRKRSLYCEKLLKKEWRPGDLILQIAGLFAPVVSLEHLPGPYAVFLSFTARLSAREYPPWVPFESDKDREGWFRSEAFLYQSASLILSTNAHAKKSLVQDYRVDGQKVTVIGYGINLEKLVREEKDYSGKKILFIGYDFVRKGGPTILSAFAQVRQSLPDAELIIIGPPVPDTVPQGVNWIGPVQDRSVVAGALREAVVFVMPSICEPFGLVFLEAMANGLPCIGSYRDAMPEIIQENETGFLIEPGDAEDLAAKMKKLLTDRELCQSMGQAAAVRVDQNFTWELVGKRVTEAINKTGRLVD